MHRSVLTLVAPLILLVLGPSGVSAAPPSNDDFGDARTVAALPYSNSVNTAEATRSEADPECSGGDEHTAWYRFTPSANGNVRVAVGADFDATVSVYTGTRDDLERVACADDPPSLRFDARSGTTYHIMVASCCGDFGGGATLTVALFQRPGLDVRVGGGTADTRTGDASVGGGVTCNRGAVTYISVHVRQRTRTGRIVSGFGDTTVRCGGTARGWKTLILSDRAFRPGWARVLVSARSCRQDVCRSDRVNRVIRLSRRP